jgi:hypothetical protein
MLLQLVKPENLPKARHRKSEDGEAAALRGAAAGRHLLRCRSSTMSPHRLRRGALHLPARRSRQNGNLLLRES